MSNFELWWTQHISISPLDGCIYIRFICVCRTPFIIHGYKCSLCILFSSLNRWFQWSPCRKNPPFLTDRWVGGFVWWVIWAILRDKWKKELFINGRCWWFRNPKQPPGMYKTPCKSWGKLPTWTGARFLPSKEISWNDDESTYPPNSPPPRNKAGIFLRAYESPLLSPSHMMEYPHF